MGGYLIRVRWDGNREEVQDAQGGHADGDESVSRSLWRCRYIDCSELHGAVLGLLTGEGGLILDPTVERYAVYMDTRRAVITCPTCKRTREFRGVGVFSSE
jgi:hypothetical protein